MTKKELEWIHKTKEELIEELDKAYKEIIELNKIIDKWERIYKPKTEIVNVGENVFEKDLQKITYINKYEGYHRAERRRIFNRGVVKMTCTSKEQDNCNVEKLGCEGCYYNKKESTQNVQSDNTNETTKP